MCISFYLTMTIYKRLKTIVSDEIDALVSLPLKQLFVVIFGYTVGVTATTCCYPFLYQMVKDLNPNAGPQNTGVFVGLLISILNGGNALGSIGWGWIADRFGRRLPLLVAQFSGAVCTLILGAVPYSR
ncbi:hypothetical protein BDF22DRAFT_10749 [Syncephalis plumigaleata]|nr:hypothetical protein BDF22DRAFT_10749 [Syncephalis plumigaleata]